MHPQSIVHSMVEFTDGATIAQLSLPDMRLPDRLRAGLSRPHRHARSARIDWAALGRLDFEPPDLETFPCLGLAYEAGRVGGTAPAWLNAANEVAVAAVPRRARSPGSRSPTSSPRSLSRHDGNVGGLGGRCDRSRPHGHGPSRIEVIRQRQPHERRTAASRGADCSDRPTSRSRAPRQRERPHLGRASAWSLLIAGIVAARRARLGARRSIVVLALLVMIFLHELGHYLTAKSAGMKVTEFFLGFGPRIWSFRRGETEYGLKAIPRGRLRAHHRDAQPRRRSTRRRAPHLPGQALLAAAERRRRPAR